MKTVNNVSLFCYALMLAGFIAYVAGRFVVCKAALAYGGGIVFLFGLFLGTLLGAGIYIRAYKNEVSDVAYVIGLLVWIVLMFIPGVGAVVMVLWNRRERALLSERLNA